MGAGESVIRNVDKRSARRQYRDVFSEAIGEFRTKNDGSSQLTQQLVEKQQDLVQVFVRKRPIFDHELTQKEFDVITCLENGTEVVVHDARMQADMKGRFIDHHKFQFSATFGENDDNDKIYQRIGKPLVDLVHQGGNATIFMYGQTGSGKTYTMGGIHKNITRDLFVNQPDDFFVTVSFVELAGDVCHDILNERAKLQLLTCPNGEVMTYPCVQMRARSGQELYDIIQFGCSLRATEKTGVHDQSSRTHALCRIELSPGTMLTLVDLAGSEHRIDSAKHDAERRKECAQINSSLMKLKECIRLRAKDAKYVPYRQSKLTQLLRASFVDEDGKPSKTVMIATVSPSSKDTEHSLNTLRHASILDGQDPKTEEETRWVTGGVTEREELMPVDVTALARQAKQRQKTIRKQIQDDGQLGGWAPAPGKGQARDGSFDQVAKAAARKKADQERAKSQRRAEIEGLKRLGPALVKKLEEARAKRGEEQRKRMAILKHQEYLKEKAEAEARQQEQLLQKKKQQQQQQQEKKKKKAMMIADKPKEEVPHVVETTPISKATITGNNSLPMPPLQDRSTGAPLPWGVVMQNIREMVWNATTISEDDKEEHIFLMSKRVKPKWKQISEQCQQQREIDADAAERESATSSTVSSSTTDRVEEARRAREKLIEQEQRKLEEKLSQKTKKPFSLDSANVSELQQEILRIEQQLNDKDTNNLQKYALKQKLAKTKAVLIKIERNKKKPAADVNHSNNYDPLEIL